MVPRRPLSMRPAPSLPAGLLTRDRPARTPSRPSGQWLSSGSPPYSVGHVAGLHRIPDSPAEAGTGRWSDPRGLHPVVQRKGRPSRRPDVEAGEAAPGPPLALRAFAGKTVHRTVFFSRLSRPSARAPGVRGENGPPDRFLFPPLPALRSRSGRSRGKRSTGPFSFPASPGPPLALRAFAGKTVHRTVFFSRSPLLQAAVAEHFGDLNGVQRGALPQVVGDAPEVQAVLDG